jgi:hypothetical protein
VTGGAGFIGSRGGAASVARYRSHFDELNAGTLVRLIRIWIIRMSSRHYHLDRQGRVTLIGLTSEETLEFEILSQSQLRDSDGASRYRDLHDKYRRGTVRHLNGLLISEVNSPATSQHPGTTELDPIAIKPPLTFGRRREIATAIIASAFVVVTLLAIANSGS